MTREADIPEADNVRVIKKKLVDEIRRGLSQAGSPDSAIALRIAEILGNRNIGLIPGELFPLAVAIRNALKAQIDPDWILKSGIPKATKIRVPNAVIISNTLKINPEIQKHLNGCIYVSSNRALFFFADTIYLCDVTACYPTLIAKENNVKTIEKMEAFLQEKNSKRNGIDELDSILSQAKALNFDDGETREFDHETKEDTLFSSNFLDFQTELMNRLAWLNWLKTASEKDIGRELMANRNAFDWLLIEDNTDRTVPANNKQKGHLRLVKDE